MTHNNTTLTTLPPFIEPDNIYTVAELNTAINLQLQQSFGLVYVEGEISNLIKASSGHYYFTLKDAQGQIKCALFKGFRTFIKTKLENGQKILVKARISIYVPKGDYQLIVEHVYPTGLGALQLAFEQLKKKLHSEGLFSSEYKKLLPKIPQQIFVITSPTGAAIKDILITLKRRFANIPVKIIPTIVQGTTAAESINQAVLTADKLANPKTDVLILARGGGSLEDLWAFNDENLARTIFMLKTPIITGIGHEIDFTIADLVADLRAATPTAAAEAAAVHHQDYLANIIHLESHLIKNFKHALLHLGHSLRSYQQRLLQHHPKTKLLTQIQQVDELFMRLVYLSEKSINHSNQHLKMLTHKLTQLNPLNSIRLGLKDIKYFQEQLIRLIQHKLQNSKNEMFNKAQALNSLNPLEVLARGYAVAKTSRGVIITDAQQVKAGDHLLVRVNQGEIMAEVLD